REPARGRGGWTGVRRRPHARPPAPASTPAPRAGAGRRGDRGLRADGRDLRRPARLLDPEPGGARPRQPEPGRAALARRPVSRPARHLLRRAPQAAPPPLAASRRAAATRIADGDGATGLS